MKNNEVVYISRNKLKPCAFQPRKTFDAGKLDELALSVREKGIISPLIVRKLADGTTEIVAGECRWRSTAARTTGEGVKLEEVAEVPVLYRELSDIEAQEIMLIENMQRNDLTPLEECDAFARLLAERDATGKPVHTHATLAAKIGKGESVIRSRLSLAKMTKEGRKALDTGLISYRVARRICEAPAALVPKIEDAILNEKKYPIDRWPRDFGDPMDVEDVTKLIDHLSVWITKPPFDLSDASLMPQKSNPESGERIEGGACVGCEFNSATHETEGQRKPVSRCMNAACYRKKVEIHVAAELVKAKEAGETVLKEAEAKKILERGLFGANQTHVELDKKLEEEERAAGMPDKKAPTWREVVTDKAGTVVVPVVVVVDDDGHVRRFAERKVVVAAADKLGTSSKLSLSAGRGKSLDGKERESAEKKQRAKELAEQKEKMETAFVLADWLASAVEKQRVPEAASAALVRLAVYHAGHDGCKFVAKRRGIENAKEDVYVAVRKYGEKLKAGAQLGFVFELLVAKDLTHGAGPYSGALMSDAVKPLMSFYGVELAAAKAQAKEKLSAGKKPAKEAKPEKPAAKADPKKLDPEKLSQEIIAAAKNSPAAKMAARKAGPGMFGVGPAAPVEGAPVIPGDVTPWRSWDVLTRAERTAVNVHFGAATGEELMKKEYRICSDSAGKIKVLDGRDVDKKAKAKAAKKTK